MKTELMHQNLPAAMLPVAGSRSEAFGPFARPGVGGCNASLRVPVRKANREYLRALRAAELAAWEKAGRTTDREEATAPIARFQPRSPGDVRSERIEAALYALLAAGSLMAGVASARAGLELVARWNLVVETVRSALT